MRRFVTSALVLVLMGIPCLVCSPATAQEQISFVVIVHPDNPLESVSRARVSRILLKEISRWDSGLPVQPVDLASNSQVREAFSREVHGRSVSSIKNYWQRQRSSGSATPPEEVANDAAVIAYVKSRPGAIGYVSANARLEGVKALRLTPD